MPPRSTQSLYWQYYRWQDVISALHIGKLEDFLCSHHEINYAASIRSKRHDNAKQDLDTTCIYKDGSRMNSQIGAAAVCPTISGKGKNTLAQMLLIVFT